MMFQDRDGAGRALGAVLAELELGDPLFVGIPRGGVIVAAAAAREVHAALDVIVPAKIRAPRQPELGLGAVAPDGTLVLDEQAIRLLGVSGAYLEREIEERRAEVERRTAAYRGDREPPAVEGRTAVVIDDGVATGGTVICACRSLKKLGPAELVIAVPVAPTSVASRLEREADRIICLHTPEPFVAVGQWYMDFEQVDDEEVVHALREGAR